MLPSLLLAAAVNDVRLLAGPTWLRFTAFAGTNLFQPGITRWCLLESILLKRGVRSAGHSALAEQ